VSDIDRLAMGAQSAYFVVTGVWPLVHDSSFQAVTGPKVDLWLAKVVGAIVTAVGVALGIAAARSRHREPENVALAVGSAAALGATDVVYAARGRISRVYLADAAAEAALVAAIAAGRGLRDPG
jgi:hypothetical protein